MVKTAIELFCGVGGFRLAADSMNIQTVWANDLCGNACDVYRSQFGQKDLHEGDIRELKDSIPAHDLLTAGFPCQPFSSAGKKLGIEDPRGTLFEQIVDILRQHQPPHFMLENVKRLLSMHAGWHFATILSALSKAGYFIEWRLLNAMDFGLPQNRQRVILLGTRLDLMGSVLPLRLATEQDLPSLTPRETGQLIDVRSWASIQDHGKRFPAWGVAYNDHFFGMSLPSLAGDTEHLTLAAVLENDIDPSFDFTEDTKQRVQDSEYVNRFYNGVQLLWNQGGGARMGYTVFGAEGVAPTLTASTSRHYERYYINGHFRRLTNVEYARLQGFPDDHCNIKSVYDQYSLYGNAVPPPMVKWVMQRLRDEPTLYSSRVYQLDLLSAADG